MNIRIAHFRGGPLNGKIKALPCEMPYYYVPVLEAPLAFDSSPEDLEPFKRHVYRFVGAPSGRDIYVYRGVEE